MDELYRTHAVVVFRFLLGLTRDRDLAEDLMQDTFIRATRALAGYRGGDPRAWLLAIARTTFLDHHRRRTETPTDEVDSGAEQDRDVVEQLTVRAALTRLPESQRTALVLRDELGLPYVEIAEVLGRSLGATKVLLHRARRSFRHAYAEEGGHVR